MCSAVARVQEDMAKVKAMTLLFDERLRAVENLVQAPALPCDVLWRPRRLARAMRGSCASVSLTAFENTQQASRQQQGDTPSAAKGQKRKR